MALIRNIQDSQLRIIGKIENNGGNHVIKNSNNVVLGKYCPNIDKTYDANGKEIGRGDLLMSFYSLLTK